MGKENSQMRIGYNYWGWLSSIGDEWDRIESIPKNERHAFYLGCLTMLIIGQQRSHEQLKGTADEIEKVLEEIMGVYGAMPSLAETIFGSGASND
jgi:hypothetical protein